MVKPTNSQNTKKKILYVITKSNWGGAQRYVYDLANNLPRDQFTVAVACGGEGLLVERLQEKKVRVLNIPAFQRDINFFKEIEASFQLLKIFRQENPDIIHLNSSKAGVLGSLAAFFYKLLQATCLPARQASYLPTGKAGKLQARVVFTVHGWAFKEDRNFLINFLIWLVNWFSSLFQNKIIVINKADLASAKKFITRKKLCLIHNGIGSINFIPRDKARTFLTEKTGAEISNDTLLIGTIAELTRNKGLSYLLDALAELARPNLYSDYYRGSASIVVIGDGNERKHLEQKIKRLGLQDKVFLSGFIRDANQYLKAFDIFVLPSLKEGLPYTIIDAMAAELTVVASRVGGIPDLINHGINGLLVAPKNTAELAENLEKLIQNPALRQQLGSKAKQKIENEFGFQKMLIQTIILYNNV